MPRDGEHAYVWVSYATTTRFRGTSWRRNSWIPHHKRRNNLAPVPGAETSADNWDVVQCVCSWIRARFRAWVEEPQSSLTQPVQ